MKTYWMRFGAGDPRPFTGLSPTLIYFFDSAGSTQVAPAVTEGLAGSGLYKFSWGTTNAIAFICDAATTSPGPQGRYVIGTLDQSDRSDEFGATGIAIGTTNFALGTTSVALGVTSVALGTTNVALSTTILAQSVSMIVTVAGIGSTTSSFGTSSTDPVDLYGYMKRILENLEGNNTFVKSSGALSIYSRGSSYTLAVKTIANSVSTVIKT